MRVFFAVHHEKIQVNVVFSPFPATWAKLFSKFLRGALIVLLVVGWIFSGWPQIWQNPPFPPRISIALADTAGPSAAGTGASVSGTGVGAWSNPGNITSDDTTYASATFAQGGTADSEILRASNFGFSLTDCSSIDGIKVDVQRKATYAGDDTARDKTIQLYDSAASLVGSNKADTATNWPTTEGTVSYGANNDTWSAGLTCADVQDIDFGVGVQGGHSKIGSPNNVTTEVDYMQITITWTASSVTAPTVTTNAATSITSSGATLNGEITATGGEDATQHGFAYGTDSVLSTVIATTTLGSKTGTGTFNESIGSLNAATTYYFRAYATNSGGTGYGSILNFTTDATSLTFVISSDTFPNITPGTAVFATTTLNVETDNVAGWNVTLARDDADTTMDLSSDAAINISDQTAWAPGVATTSAGNAVRISSLDSSGDVLAFRVMTASGTSAFHSTSWWGTVDSYVDNAAALWAGLPSSGQKIGDSSVSSGGAPAINTVLYYLDVPNTQKTGVYSGSITFTAVMN